MKDKKITVVIAEDQNMLLGALSSLLSLEPDIEIIAQAQDGQHAFQLIQQLTPDILLTDIEMPNMSGIDVAEKIHENKLSTQCFILTTFSRAGYVNRALKAGVRGYMLKDAPVEQLAGAIRKVINGQTALDPELILNSLNDVDPLTEKERQLLRHAEHGLNTEQIADAMFLAKGTVRNYVSTITAKLGASNRTEAARIARTKGLL